MAQALLVVQHSMELKPEELTAIAKHAWSEKQTFMEKVEAAQLMSDLDPDVFIALVKKHGS